MRSKLIAVVIVTLLALPTGASAKPKLGDWWKPGTWFSKKSRSTTITGMVESVADGKVTFKAMDGQMLQLIGDKAAAVAENRSVKVRVFGNIFKPDQKYPAGALQVRNYQLLEEATVMVAEPIAEPEPYVEPEPIVEQIVEPEIEHITDPEPVIVNDDYDNDVDANADHDSDDDESTMSKHDEKTYVVASGDTLGKISSKVYGSASKWKKIAQHNGITNPKLLKVGMTLRIP